MRNDIVGARGMSLPRRSFGGFETFIAGLAPRLAVRGHTVIVYSRRTLYPHGRWYFRFAAWASTSICRTIVADSRAIADLYARQFRAGAIFVPYAFDPRDPRGPSRIRALGLEPKGYYLVVGRVIPENKACAIVFDVVFNREVVGDAGVTFSREAGTLKEVLEWLNRHPDEDTCRAEKGQHRLAEYNSWPQVVERYDAVLARLPV